VSFDFEKPKKFETDLVSSILSLRCRWYKDNSVSPFSWRCHTLFIVTNPEIVCKTE